jgi:hypothetical protein
MFRIVRRNKAKLQWLQNPRQMHGYVVDSVRHKSSRTLREKGREYQKKLMSLKQMVRTENTTDLCRGRNEFKKVYQPGSNFIQMRMLICL